MHRCVNRSDRLENTQHYPCMKVLLRLLQAAGMTVPGAATTACPGLSRGWAAAAGARPRVVMVRHRVGVFSCHVSHHSDAMHIQACHQQIQAQIRAKLNLQTCDNTSKRQAGCCFVRNGYECWQLRQVGGAAALMMLSQRRGQPCHLCITWCPGTCREWASQRTSCTSTSGCPTRWVSSCLLDCHHAHSLCSLP